MAGALASHIRAGLASDLRLSGHWFARSAQQAIHIPWQARKAPDGLIAILIHNIRHLHLIWQQNFDAGQVISGVST
jgi:hypothetical protein